MTVTYRDIPGFPGYRVGDDGSVWSCWVRGKNRGIGGGSGSGRKVQDHNRWKQLTPCPRPNGYFAVCLHVEGKRRFVSVHSLVLKSFVGPKPPSNVARHLNGIQTDNRLENLAWGTSKENAADRDLHGTTQRGECHFNTRLTSEQVIEARIMHAAKTPVKEIAAAFGYSVSGMEKILYRDSWGHV